MKPAYHKKSEFEPDAKRDDQRKTRKCLVCETPFLSEWAGERVCLKCKSSKTWRRGGC